MLADSWLVVWCRHISRATIEDNCATLIRSLDGLDKATAVTYDAGDNQLTVRDPNSVGADMVYDSLGRNTQRTDTFGDVTKTDFDKAGNAVKQTDAKNKFTLIAFDSRNRRKSTTDRISAATTFAYLSTGQLASLTDAENQTTSYTYDARGSKLTEKYPDHTSGSTVGQPGYGIVTFTYDKAGRVSRKQDQAGETCSYNYDLAGRMTSRNYRTAANSPSGTIADTDSFTFDRSGRMLTAVSGRYTNTVGYAYDPVGRKASESLTIAGQTYTVGTGYNARNELTKVTYPDNSISDRTYDARGALKTLKLDNVTIDTRNYDNGGRRTSEVLGNGITETRAYRTDNLLSSISYSNTNIGNLGYSWDANKNKTAETIAGVMSGYGFTSAGTSYDFEDRLTGYQRAATSGSAVLAQSWSLTSVGDWSSVTTNGTAVTRTHGPTHELLTSGGQSVTTDVKGNQTVLPASLATQAAQLGFSWDFDNRMKSSDIDANGSADVTFEHDALGRQIGRTQGSTAVVYVQADQQKIADYPRGGAASTASYRYVFGSYIDEPVVRKTTGTGGTVLYYHRNQQYSIYALTNASGVVQERYAYTAYGQPTFLNASAAVQTSSAAGNRYTYTAREWDATLGIHYFRARWMSGLTGRFLTRDPIGFDGGSYGIYEIFYSHPLAYVDPMGFCAEDKDKDDPKYDDPECCEKFKKDFKEEIKKVGGVIATVICCKGKYIRCIVKGAKERGFTDPEAIKLIDRCVKAHEKEHIDKKHILPCDKKKDIDWPGSDPKVSWHERECVALGAELPCLEAAKKECTTDACRAEMDEVIADAKSDRDYHCAEWKKEKGSTK